MERTYGSLCTGYDGIGLGLALAGLSLQHRFMAETEASVAHVLKAEYPDVPNVGDIKTVPWELAPQCDIWSSGDPCQSISVAGRQAGREDPRFLWPWVRASYRAGRPQVILFENVANLVSHDGGRTMAERFAHLREDGYAVRWTVLGACAVGAPHHRHRWFAMAWRVSGPAPEAVRMGGPKAICGAPRGSGRALLASPKATDHKGPGAKRVEQGKAPWHDLPTHVALLPTPSAADGSGGPGVSDKRLGGLNLRTAVTLLPTPMAERSGSNRGGSAGRGDDQPLRPSLDSVASLLPTPRATDGVNGGPSQRGSSGDLAMGSACQPEHWGRYAEAVALWERVTGIPAPVPTVPGPNGGVRLNPELPEWMMGLRPGLLTERMSRNDALRAAGNGVVPLQAAAAWKVLTE